jgi:hypothetical protein
MVVLVEDKVVLVEDKAVEEDILVVDILVVLEEDKIAVEDIPVVDTIAVHRVAEVEVDIPAVPVVDTHKQVVVLFPFRLTFVKMRKTRPHFISPT